MDITTERLKNNYDFLRLLAALCIALTHSFDLLGKNINEPLRQISGQRFDFSFIGLSLFFSISGYLIVKSATRSGSSLSFFWKRFLRIQPLLFIVCIFTVLVVGPLFTSLPAEQYFHNFFSWSYMRNVFPATGIQFLLPGVFTTNPGEAGVNGSLWTLVIEERLYIFVGLCFIFRSLAKKFFPWLVLILNIFFLINSNFLHQPMPAFLDGAAIFYALIFLNAGSLYLLKINVETVSLKHVLLLTAAVIACVCVPMLKPMLVLITPLLVIILANVRSVFNKTGSRGDFTYGLYLFAFPVQQMLIAGGRGSSAPIFLFLETVMICLPMAVLSWHLVEKKMLKLKGIVS